MGALKDDEMTNPKFSKEFKNHLVSKVLTDPKRSIRSVANEAQVGVSSLHKWIQETQHHSVNQSGSIDEGLSLAKRPKDWSVAQKFEALVASVDLKDEQLHQYCRQQGIYKHQLEQWKLDFMSEKESKQGLDKKQANELKELRHKNKQLQRELYRKEKALAEVSALLVLKKKTDLIWSVTEEDVFQ